MPTGVVAVGSCDCRPSWRDVAAVQRSAAPATTTGHGYDTRICSGVEGFAQRGTARAAGTPVEPRAADRAPSGPEKGESDGSADRQAGVPHRGGGGDRRRHGAGLRPRGCPGRRDGPGRRRRRPASRGAVGARRRPRGLRARRDGSSRAPRGGRGPRRRRRALQLRGLGARGHAGEHRHHRLAVRVRHQRDVDVRADAGIPAALPAAGRAQHHQRRLGRLEPQGGAEPRRLHGEQGRGDRADQVDRPRLPAVGPPGERHLSGNGGFAVAARERTGDHDAAWQTFIARQPIGCMATPEEIAHLAVFLASDESAYATGANFVLDGGITM